MSGARSPERSWWRSRRPYLIRERDEWGEVQLVRAALGLELRFDDGALQGRLDPEEPWRPLSEYAVSMSLAPALLSEPQSLLYDGSRAPAQVCLLGVGTASLAWSYQRALPEAELHLVELREAVLKVARRGLRLGELPHRHELIDSAERALPRFESGRFDLIAVDLFMSTGMAPALMSPSFWAELFRALKPEGLACVNLWSSDPEAYERLLELIRAHRGPERVTRALSHLSFSNVILFIGAPVVMGDELIRRAAALDELLGLDAPRSRRRQKKEERVGLSGEPLASRAARLAQLS